ncbi:MAG: hypothetical protein J3Q66DRAFT_84940 [Benniella sp.]|nr:MAG: hypothetical protein J3Q66DRAFT_84940 [Benniella sp.]
MESASVSNRHPRTLQKQGLAMAGTTRGRQGLAGKQNAATATRHTGQQPGSVQSLAERVYSWSVHDLDYRPDNSNTISRSLTTARTHHNSNSAELFCPQALESLCDGPCAAMFEYLMENIKPSSSVRLSRPPALDSSRQTQVRVAKRAEQQAKTLRCRDLVLTVAQKRREVEEAKERIRHQRQLQSMKEIHHQQTIHRAQILQEYQSFFQKLRLEVAPLRRDRGSNRYALELTLARTAEEALKVIRQVAIE